MELTNEDKQRIHEAALNYSKFPFDHSRFEIGAEYATLYERAQQQPQMEYANNVINKQAEHIQSLEADVARLESIQAELRNKVIDECIQSLIIKGVKGISLTDLQRDDISKKLTSLKTK